MPPSRGQVAVVLSTVALLACSDGPVEPESLIAEVRKLVGERGLAPIQTAPPVRPELVALPIRFDERVA